MNTIKLSFLNGQLFLITMYIWWRPFGRARAYRAFSSWWNQEVGAWKYEVKLMIYLLRTFKLPSMLLAPTDEQYPREELLFVEPTNELLLFFLCVQSFGILNTHLLW